MILILIFAEALALYGLIGECAGARMRAHALVQGLRLRTAWPACCPSPPEGGHSNFYRPPLCLTTTVHPIAAQWVSSCRPRLAWRLPSRLLRACCSRLFWRRVEGGAAAAQLPTAGAEGPSVPGTDA